MRKMIVLVMMLVMASVAWGQVSKDPVTVATDVYFWKASYDQSSTMITVSVSNCSDWEATHFLISVNWQAGADTGATSKLVKRHVNGSGFLYVVVGAPEGKVVIPSVTVTPMKVQPMSTARYTMAGKEYVEP